MTPSRMGRWLRTSTERPVSPCLVAQEQPLGTRGQRVFEHQAGRTDGADVLAYPRAHDFDPMDLPGGTVRLNQSGDQLEVSR